MESLGSMSHSSGDDDVYYYPHLDPEHGAGHHTARLVSSRAHVHALVPLVDELDGEGPVVLARGVSHSEPLVLGEGVGSRAQNVPVA